MLWKSLAAICIGASLGALLRWGLSAQLNGLFPALPPGTLLSNLLGAFIVGAAIAFFATAPSVSPEWRLFIVTGFCGALTTFSAFSVELVELLRQGQTAWALGAMAAHVTGSVLMTMAGIGVVAWLRS